MVDQVEAGVIARLPHQAAFDIQEIENPDPSTVQFESLENGYEVLIEDSVIDDGVQVSLYYDIGTGDFGVYNISFDDSEAAIIATVALIESVF